MGSNLKSFDYRENHKRVVSIKRNANFHYFPDKTVLTVTRSNENKLGLYLNETATEILEMCDGRNTLEDIVRDFRKRHEAPMPKVRNSVCALIIEGLKGGYLRLSNVPLVNRISKTGSKKYYLPQHLTLEVTSFCNEKCLHCYGDFSNSRKNYFDFPKLLRILEEFLNSGLHVVTMTGGEPFTYKRIEDLLVWILPKIDALGIISNGTLISNSAIDVLKMSSQKILFQTSINGRKEYHDHFTRLPGSFDRVIKNMRSIVEAGIRVRLTMNVNEHNLNDIQYVAKLAYEFDVAMLSVAVAQNIGREQVRREYSPFFEGKNPDNNIEMIKRISKQIEIARLKYPHLFLKRCDFESTVSAGGNDPSINPETLEKPYACGAGRKSVYLDSMGNVQLCAISAACGFPILGNMFSNSLEEIMSSSMAMLVSKLPAPSQAFCDISCKHFAFCGGCIARGYSKFIQEGTNCKWAKDFAEKIRQEKENFVLIS